MTFKDLKKRVNLEETQQQSRLAEDYSISLSGSGILNYISRKISKQTAIAASITLLLCHRRMDTINPSMTMRK